MAIKRKATSEVAGGRSKKRRQVIFEDEDEYEDSDYAQQSSVTGAAKQSHSKSEAGGELSEPRITLHAVSKVRQYAYLRRLREYWTLQHKSEGMVNCMDTLKDIMAGEWQFLILRCKYQSSEATYDEVYTRAAVFDAVVKFAIIVRELDDYAMTEDNAEDIELVDQMMSDLRSTVDGLRKTDGKVLYEAQRLRSRAPEKEMAAWAKHGRRLLDPAVGKILILDKDCPSMGNIINQQPIVALDTEDSTFIVDTESLLQSFYDYKPEPCGYDTDGTELWEWEAILDHRRLPNKEPEYLIRWKGWVEADWQPLSCLINVSPEWLLDFHEKHPQFERPHELRDRVRGDGLQRNPMWIPSDQSEALEAIRALQATIRQFEDDLAKRSCDKSSNRGWIGARKNDIKRRYDYIESELI